MKVYQAFPGRGKSAIEAATALGCSAIAWDIDGEVDGALLLATKAAGMASHGWWRVARDTEAVAAHPEWMHAPQHHEWLRRYPGFRHGHPALVAPYLGLNTVAAFAHALERSTKAIVHADWAERFWVADIQGAPMGCGCGNPSCRSWDNAPGPKLASTPYDRPEVLFPLEFFTALTTALPDRQLIPILCPECERSVCIGGVDDPDGPDGTDLCQGVPCGDVCTKQFFPRLLAGFRSRFPSVGLLLLVDALEKGRRDWVERAISHYGPDLLPCVEPLDAPRIEGGLVVSDAPQTCWPVSPPPGYVPEVPPIRCGYCPPED